MAVKAIKIFVSAVLGLVVALYPEKAAAVGLLIATTAWNIAVMIGENFKVPGEGKVKSAASVAAVVVPLMLHFRPIHSLRLPGEPAIDSDQKDINHDH